MLRLGQTCQRVMITGYKKARTTARSSQWNSVWRNPVETRNDTRPMHQKTAAKEKHEQTHNELHLRPNSKYLLVS